LASTFYRLFHHFVILLWLDWGLGRDGLGTLAGDGGVAAAAAAK
jgi:hypothetical protein